MLDHSVPRVESPAFRAALTFVTSARFALLAGLALIVFIFLPGRPYRLDQYDVPKDVGLGVLGVACGLLLLSRQHPCREDRIGFTLLAFLCWGAITVPLAGINETQGWSTLGIFGAATTVFLLARAVGRLGGAYEIYWGVLGIVFVMCALVLLEAYGGIPFLSAPGRRPGATLGNRNLVARLASLTLPLLWNRSMAVNRTAIRLLLLTITSVAVAVIVLSRSRGAFLISCGLVIFLPLATRRGAFPDTYRRWRMAAFPWIAGVVFAVAAIVVLPNRLGWSATDFASSALRVAEYQTGTGRGRVIQAETSWRMIRRHPLWGVGPGNWSVVYPAYASAGDPSVMLGAYYPGPQIPRNDILTLVAEWGLLGVSVGLAFCSALVERTWRLLTSPEARARSAGSIVLSVCLVAALLGMFDSIVRVAPSVVLVALLVGVALGDGEAAAGLTRGGEYQLWRLYTWGALLAGCVVVSFGLARSAAQDFGALRIINSFSSRNDLERAVSIAPNNVEARALLSFVLVNAGRCDLAAPHISRAARLQPFSLLIAGFQEQCGIEKKHVVGLP
jgi:O-antigen ligase